MAEGGRVCLLESRRYDPSELLDTIEREKVNAVVFVGDPFARPLLAALDDHPGKWDLSSLVMIISSGAMWSEPVKEGLLAHHPGMLLVDAFSSSEALGMGVSVSASGAAAKTASFTLGPDVKVLTEDGRQVEPGSDEVGVLALGGRNPLGYYKDEEKSATHLQGDRRGALLHPRRLRPGRQRRHHPPARAGLGLHQLWAARRSSPRRSKRLSRRTMPCATPWSSESRTRPTASRSWPWWSSTDGAAQPAEAELIDHVKARLASYKAPRRVRTVPTIGRAANGKVDYKRHRAESIDELGDLGAAAS